MTNLLGPEPTLLPDDHPDTAARAAIADGATPRQVAADLPASSFAWGQLAWEALQSCDPVAGYAYARTGYHRGLDALRRAGWRGAGAVPATHVPNQGFLISLLALAEAADRIGEADESQRCRALAHDCDPAADDVLLPGTETMRGTGA